MPCMHGEYAPGITSSPMLLTLAQTYTYEKTKQKFHDHYAYAWPAAVVFNLWAMGAFCGGLELLG